MINLKEEQVTKWFSRIERAEERRDPYEDEWKGNVRAFEGKPFAKDEVGSDVVTVNKDWPRVKQKQSQLFFHVPEVNLKPRQEVYRGAVPVFQSALNFYLQHRVRAHIVADENITDALCPSGLAFSKIGYRVVTNDVEEFVQDVSMLQPEEIEAGLQAGTIQKIKVPTPIFEEYFWERISPMKALIPEEFHGSDFDKAPWLGFEFRMPLERAKREFKLPDNFSVSTDVDEHTLSIDSKHRARGADGVKQVTGYEIWYRTYLFDPAVKHPLLMRRLVLIKGYEKPVVHDDSPYQKLDQVGKIIGITKFPIRVLSLTYAPDEAYVPSDASISRPQVQEIWAGRTQMVEQRKRSIPLRWADRNALDPDTKAKFEAGEVQDIILLDGDGNRALGEVARANYPRENFEFYNIAERDIDEQWSMGSTQLGTETKGETTAEEIRNIQGNVNARLDYERNKVLRWFADGAEIVATLMQMFAEDEDYVEVVGQDGTKQIQAWDRTRIAGEFVFEVKPDTAQRVDAAKERDQSLKLYQMLANEPHVNRFKLVEKVLQTHNIDPTPIAIPQLPQKGPEAPNVSYRFNGPDLMNPVVLAIMKKAGVEITLEELQAANTLILAAQAMQPMVAMGVPMPPMGGTAVPPAAPMMGQGPMPSPEHGGPAQQATPLSKHQLTGDGF